MLELRLVSRGDKVRVKGPSRENTERGASEGESLSHLEASLRRDAERRRSAAALSRREAFERAAAEREEERREARRRELRRRYDAEAEAEAAEEARLAAELQAREAAWREARAAEEREAREAEAEARERQRRREAHAARAGALRAQLAAAERTGSTAVAAGGTVRPSDAELRAEVSEGLEARLARIEALLEARAAEQVGAKAEPQATRALRSEAEALRRAASLLEAGERDAARTLLTVAAPGRDGGSRGAAAEAAAARALAEAPVAVGRAFGGRARPTTLDLRRARLAPPRPPGLAAWAAVREAEERSGEPPCEPEVALAVAYDEAFISSATGEALEAATVEAAAAVAARWCARALRAWHGRHKASAALAMVEAQLGAWLDRRHARAAIQQWRDTADEGARTATLMRTAAEAGVRAGVRRWRRANAAKVAAEERAADLAELQMSFRLSRAFNCWARRAEAAAMRRAAEGAHAARAQAAAEAAEADVRAAHADELATAADVAEETAAIAQAAAAEARAAAIRLKKQERAAAETRRAAVNAAATADALADDGPAKQVARAAAEAAEAEAAAAAAALDGLLAGEAKAAAHAHETKTAAQVAEDALTKAVARAEAAAASARAEVLAHAPPPTPSVPPTPLASRAMSGRSTPRLPLEVSVGASPRQPATASPEPSSTASCGGQMRSRLAAAASRSTTSALATAETRRKAEARAAEAKARAEREARRAAEARAVRAEATLAAAHEAAAVTATLPTRGAPLADASAREVRQELDALRAERQARRIDDEVRLLRERASEEAARLRQDTERALANARQEDETLRRFARLEDQLNALRASGGVSASPAPQQPKEEQGLRSELQDLVEELRAARAARQAEAAVAEAARRAEARAAAEVAEAAATAQAAASAEAAERARAHARAAADAQIGVLEGRLSELEGRIRAQMEAELAALNGDARSSWRGASASEDGATQAGGSETDWDGCEALTHERPVDAPRLQRTRASAAPLLRAAQPVEGLPPPPRRWRSASPKDRLLALENNLRRAMARSQKEAEAAQGHARPPPRPPRHEAETAAGAVAAEAASLARAATAAAGRNNRCDDHKIAALESAMAAVQALLEDSSLDVDTRELLGRDMADFSRQALAGIAANGGDGVLDVPPDAKVGTKEACGDSLDIEVSSHADDDVLRAAKGGAKAAEARPVSRSDKAGDFERLMAQGHAANESDKLRAAIAAFTDEDW